MILEPIPNLDMGACSVSHNPIGHNGDVGGGVYNISHRIEEKLFSTI